MDVVGDGFGTEHVLSEILKRLPVKSLLRFLSVSKPLNHIISDPFFVNTHLQFNKQYSSSLSVLGINIYLTYSGIDKDRKFHYYRIDNAKKTTSEHLAIEFPWKEHMKNPKVDDKEGVRILGHSNGVVLALYSLDSSQDMYYIVTNPITRSFHVVPESGIELPNLTFVDDPRDHWIKNWDNKKLVAIGFGFLDDLVYKVVRVTHGVGRFMRGSSYWNQYRAYEPLWVEVYDSRSLSWRRVLVDPDLSYEHIHGGVYNNGFDYAKYGRGGVYNSFDGCVYWLGKTTTRDSAIVWFDLVTETMHQTLLPYKPRYDDDDRDEDGVFGKYGTSLGVQVSGRSVVVLVGDQRNRLVFSVWKMNKEEGHDHDHNKVSWTHMYRLVFGGSPIGFSRNGEFLLRSDKGGKDRWKKIHLYDSEKIDDDGCFGFTDLGFLLGNIVPDFVESLVLLDRGN